MSGDDSGVVLQLLLLLCFLIGTASLCPTPRTVFGFLVRLQHCGMLVRFRRNCLDAVQLFYQSIFRDPCDGEGISFRSGEGQKQRPTREGTSRQEEVEVEGSGARPKAEQE